MISHRKRVDDRPEADAVPSTQLLIVALHRPRDDQHDQVAQDGQADGQTASSGAVAQPSEEEHYWKGQKGADGGDGVGADFVEAEGSVALSVSIVVRR